jgi:hypothetical protein
MVPERYISEGVSSLVIRIPAQGFFVLNRACRNGHSGNGCVNSRSGPSFQRKWKNKNARCRSLGLLNQPQGLESEPRKVWHQNYGVCPRLADPGASLEYTADVRKYKERLPVGTAGSISIIIDLGREPALILSVFTTAKSISTTNTDSVTDTRECDPPDENLGMNT